MSCLTQLGQYVDSINISGDEPLVRLVDAGSANPTFCEWDNPAKNFIITTPTVGFVALPGNIVRINQLLVPPQWTLVLAADSGGISSYQFSSVYYDNLVTSGLTFNGPVSGVFVALFSTYYSLVRNKEWSSVTQPNSEIYDMCTLNIPYFLGPFRVSRWVPQSGACDDFMNSYCSSSINASTDICSCITGQAELIAKYGQNLPVSCFDPNCANVGGPCCPENGYRTDDILKQGCSLTICESIIKENGQNITNAGDVTIYCGGKEWNVNDANFDTNTPIPEKFSEQPPTEWYVWLLLIIAFAIAGAIILFVTYKYK